MNEAGKISVLLADDHSFFRKGLFMLLQQTGKYEMVGEAKSGEDLVKMAIEFEPDIAIVDISMPYQNGIDATKRIREKGLKTSILAFSYYDDDYMILKMMNLQKTTYKLLLFFCASIFLWVNWKISEVNCQKI